MITKMDLVKIVAEEENFTTSAVASIIDKAASIIIQKVSEGETVNIKDFGTFLVSNRAERNGFNPQTKQPMIIEARKVPHFRAGKAFKTAVNK